MEPTHNPAPGTDEQSAQVLDLARKLVAATAAVPAGRPIGTGGAVMVRGRGELDRVAAGDGATAAAELGAQVARVVRIAAGRRARRLPYLATAITLVTGWAGWGITAIARAGAGPGGALVATGGIAAACVVTIGVLRLARPVAPRWRARWWTAAAGASCWVIAAAVFGTASWMMTAALAVGAALVSSSWLREHEVPQPGDAATPPTPAEPVAEAEVVDDDLGEVLARRWAENIARNGRVVPGSMLTDRHDFPRAIRWTVQTTPGSVSFAELFARRDRIASGLRWSAAKVLLEPSDEDESYAQLTVITHDLLAAGIPYTGPRYQAGRIPLGPYADGAGEAEYIAYDQVGCRNGMATGEPGGGKSAFLEAVALGLRSSCEWVVWFGDGDPEGGSSPLLNEIADWTAAGPQEVLAQLEALEALLELRGLLKATLTADPDTGLPIPITDPGVQRPVRELRPCPQFPAVKWILDELHRLTSDQWLIERQFAKRLERLVRIGRKYGIVLLTGSQSLLAPDYGNSTPLRGYLAARNLFAFRNGNKSEKAVVSGLEISPSVLPTGGGYAFAAGAGRLAMTRVAWAPDMARHAADLPDTVLDRDSALAVAAFRPAAPRDPATTYAEQAARLQAWRTGQGDTGTAGDPARTVLPAPLGKTGPTSGFGSSGVGGGGFGSGDALAGLSVPAALGAANVITMPTRRSSGPVRPMQDGPDLDALNTAQRAVHDALQAGTERTGEIAAATGLRLPAVSKALSALADLGLAHNLAHGRWAPAPDPTRTG